MKPEKSKSLHSRYNPQGEAERYAASLSLNEDIRYFILIEPGLCYLAAPLRKKNPAAKIIALHVEKPAGTPAASPREEGPDSEWYPEKGVSVQDFLEAEISNSNAAGIRLVEWRPALSVYGGAYLALLEETTAFIKRADANARTLETFGRLWFRNFFKNLDMAKNLIIPAPFSLPVLVTGAGPGLEDAIPLIRDERETGGLFILASSSSVPALRAGKLNADLVITTDGTGWAKFHLHEILGRKSADETQDRTGPCPVAAALTAALPSQCETSPLLLLSDGSLWQTLILKKLNMPFITLPQRGTVSASAIDLAFTLSEGDVFFAGMDLANRDIRSHARPYSFDRFMEEKAERTNPVYSQTYKRSSMLKAGGSYGIYASWFKKQLDSYPRRLHPLGKNNPVFDGLETPSARAGMPENKPGGKARAGFKTIAYNGETGRPQKALALLEDALKNSVNSRSLQKELASLLLPEKTYSSPRDELDEIIETLHSVTIPSPAGFCVRGKNG